MKTYYNGFDTQEVTFKAMTNINLKELLLFRIQATFTMQTRASPSQVSFHHTRTVLYRLLYAALQRQALKILFPR